MTTTPNHNPRRHGRTKFLPPNTGATIFDHNPGEKAQNRVCYTGTLVESYVNSHS